MSSYLEHEWLRLRDFARGDTLKRGVLPGVHLHVSQPREMRHLVCWSADREERHGSTQHFWSSLMLSKQKTKMEESLFRTSATTTDKFFCICFYLQVNTVIVFDFFFSLSGKKKKKKSQRGTNLVVIFVALSLNPGNWVTMQMILLQRGKECSRGWV